MHLPEEYKTYKVETAPSDSSKVFFTLNTADTWSFGNYFKQTHPSVNKFKNYKTIDSDFKDDLHWISQLNGVPEAIKDYVRSLKDEKRTKAKAKSDIAKSYIPKRRKLNNSVVFNAPITGSNLRVINNSIVHQLGESTASNQRSDEGKENKDPDMAKDKEAAVKIKQSVWNEWIKFINAKQEMFHPFSPEAHNIIRSGRGVSPRPSLDTAIYKNHLDSHPVQKCSLPICCLDYINKVIDSEDLSQFKSNIRSYVAMEENRKDVPSFEFFEELFREALRAYSSPIPITTNEDAFNQLFVWPYLRTVTESVSTHLNCKAGYIQGEPYLESMHRQLKSIGMHVNDSSQYKTDSMVKLFGLKNIELLFLETSGKFNSEDMVKLNFDHHKATFGTLAVLKCVADDFSFASVETFTKVKVFFVQGAGDQIHLWSVRFDSSGIFDLWREATCQIKPKFEDKLDYLPSLIQFSWTAKCLLEEAIENISCLKKEDSAIRPKYKFAECNQLPELLSDVVNPVILKLSKDEDSLGMAALGPFYSSDYD